jgi:hypothetical protein
MYAFFIHVYTVLITASLANARHKDIDKNAAKQYFNDFERFKAI